MEKPYEYCFCAGSYVGSFLILFLPHLLGMRVYFHSEMNMLMTYLGFIALIISLALIHLSIYRKTLTFGRGVVLLLLSYEGAAVASRGIYGTPSYPYFIPISAGFFAALFVYLYSETSKVEKREDMGRILEKAGVDAIFSPERVWLSDRFSQILGTEKRISREEFERKAMEKFKEITSLKFLSGISSKGVHIGGLVSEEGKMVFYVISRFGRIGVIKILEEAPLPPFFSEIFKDFLGFMVLSEGKISHMEGKIREIFGEDLMWKDFREAFEYGKELFHGLLLLPTPFPMILVKVEDYLLAFRAKAEMKEAIMCSILDYSKRIGVALLREGIVEYATRGVLEIFGMRNEEIIGKPFWSFFSERDKSAISSRIVDLRYGRARYVRREATVETYSKRIPIEIEMMAPEKEREYQIAIMRPVEGTRRREECEKVLNAISGIIPEAFNMLKDYKYSSLLFSSVKYLLSSSEEEGNFKLHLLLGYLSSLLDLSCEVEEGYETRLTDREIGAIIALLSWIKRHSDRLRLEIRKGEIRILGVEGIPEVKEVLNKLEGESPPSRGHDLWISLHFLRSIRKKFEVSFEGNEIRILER